jgi:hypothetical protein
MFCYSVTNLENNNLEQHYAIKFCVKLGEGATDTHEKIKKTFGNDSLSRCSSISVAQRLCKWARKGGRPTSVRTSTNIDRVRTFTLQDRRLKIRMIADELNINDCTDHQIVIQDFNMRKVCAKVVPNI